MHVGKKCENEIEDWKSEQKKMQAYYYKALNTASLRQFAVRLQVPSNLDLCLFSLSNLCV